MKENPSDEYLKISSDKLIDSRPTAVNLKSAIDIMNRELQNINKKDRHEVSLKLALRDDDKVVSLPDPYDKDNQLFETINMISEMKSVSLNK